MRALPGRATRTVLEAPAAITRGSGQSSDQRRRIMRATGELVAKRGYNDVTVELIVKRARVSFKTFYKHFSGKEEAFLELFDSVYAYAQHKIGQTLAAEPEAPWPEQVAAALRSYVDLIVADPIVARACIVEGPTAGPVILKRYERASHALVPLLLRGREFSPGAAELPETLEVTLAGSVLWSAYQRLIIGETDRLQTLLPEVLELVLRPYLGERAAAEFSRAALAESQPA